MCLVLQGLTRPSAAAGCAAQAVSTFPWNGAALGDLSGRLFSFAKVGLFSAQLPLADAGFILGSLWEGTSHFLPAINILVKATLDFE